MYVASFTPWTPRNDVTSFEISGFSAPSWPEADPVSRSTSTKSGALNSTCQSVPSCTCAPRIALSSNEWLVMIGYRLTLDIKATISRNATVRCGFTDM